MCKEEKCFAAGHFSCIAPFTCRGGGILPEDRAAERRRDQLRRERQEEYRAFLKQQSSNKFRERTINDSTSGPSTTSYPRPSSVAEKRKALAQERHQELQSHSKPPLPFPHYKPARAVNEHETSREADNQRRMWPDRGGPHDVLEEHHRCSGDERLSRALARERERDYSQGVGARTPPQRQRWEERGISNRQVHFDHEYDRDGRQMEPKREYPSQRRHWDEEEEGLMQWARGQGKSKGLESRPPSSPTQSNVKRAGGSRSLSAPVVGGIAALGAGSSEADKKKKQREYAEQLRAQMRDKQAAKEREREGISSGTHSQSQHPQQADRGRPSSPWRHSYSNVEEHSSRALSPRRRERVRFSPERNIHFGPDSTATSSKPPGHPAPLQPYWPGMYYGGYPYPPPASFPPFPPPQIGHPYYPPPPSLPPSLNTNPYLSPYIPPHYHSDSRQQTTRDKSSNGRLSPRKPMEASEVEELNFVLRESDSGKGMAKAKKDSYRLQLLEQMSERNENKQKECLEKREFERRKQQEVYDPFGKGGCGAPIRDKRGQLVTDLKQMKKVNDERMIIGLPSTTPLPGEIAEGGAAGILDGSFNEPNSPRSSYEFRRSKELRSKSVQDDYKETLEQQMREREEIKRREKEKKSEADKLETERIERECKLLEEKYKLEREGEKQLKMRNEALKREEEEREREEAERKREEEWRQQEALKLEAEKKKLTFIENMEKQLPVESQPRSSSPPIPTLRKMDPQFPAQTAIPSHPQLPQQQLPTSPPVPTLHHKHLIASNNRGQGGTQEYPNNNGVPPEHQSQRTSTATIRRPDSAKLELLQRSFSAHAGVPQPVNAPNEKAGVSGGSSMNVVGSSRSAQHLPPPHPAEAIPQSLSEPRPSSSGVSATYGAPEDDVMENLLRNLHSVRRKLETERQKVIAPKEPDQSTTRGDANPQGPWLPAGVDPNGGNNKPGFWKARLAGHRKNRPTSSHPHHPPPRVPQQREEKRGEDKPRRRQWKLIPRENIPLQISSEHDEDRYSASGTREETAPNPHPRHARNNNSQRLGGEDRRHVEPPSWLRPRLPQSHDPTRGNYDFTDSHSLRPPSVGGESQFSMATLDVDGMARRNEERMRRLESILNSQARDSRTPQSILSDFLSRNGRTKDYYNQTSSKNGVSSSPRRPFAANVFTPPDVCQSRDSDTSQELDYETGYPVAASTPT